MTPKYDLEKARRLLQVEALLRGHPSLNDIHAEAMHELHTMVEEVRMKEEEEKKAAMEKTKPPEPAFKAEQTSLQHDVPSQPPYRAPMPDRRI